MSGLEVPLMVAAIGASVGGSIISASAQQNAGQEKAAAADFEAEQYKIQEQQTRTAAIQDETARRRELTSSLESIQAIRAGRGVGAGSPTGMAIFDNSVTQSEDDIASSKANYLTKAELASRSAAMSTRKAQSSLLAGDMGAASAIFSGVSQVASLGLRAGRGASTGTGA